VTTLAEPDIAGLEDDRRPACSARRKPDDEECGAPAAWWHRLVCCKRVVFRCDCCHWGILEATSPAVCLLCNRVFSPACAAITAFGRL